MDTNSDLKMLIEILKTAKANITDSSDFLWTSYNNAEELNAEINSIIVRLEQKDIKALSNVYILFAPTSTFQEHSMMNNWLDEYMRLAEQFDDIYERNKNT